MGASGRSDVSRGRATRSRSSEHPALRLVATPDPSRGQGVPPAGTAGHDDPAQAARRLTVLAELEETGALWCPVRTARVARDRCVELQHRMGCGRACWKGKVARELRAKELVEDAQAEVRAEKARALQGTNPPPRDPWKLTCGYRGCGRTFEADRVWGRKPGYCSDLHRKWEAEARAADRRYGGRTPV